MCIRDRLREADRYPVEVRRGGVEAQRFVGSYLSAAAVRRPLLLEEHRPKCPTIRLNFNFRSYLLVFMRRISVVVCPAGFWDRSGRR